MNERIRSPESAEPAPRTERVAVVIPCRDEASTLGRCIRSIRAQDPPPDTIVVVDNGSTDGSDVVAANLADVVVSVPDGSVGHVRNVGVAAGGDSDVVAFIDADCEAEAGWLARARAGLAEAELVGARTLAGEGDTWVARRWAAVHRRIARPQSSIGAANMAVRRRTFDLVGGFSAILESCEDVDLCRRVRARGGHVAVVPEMAVVHHGYPSTLGAFMRRQLRQAATPGWWWMMTWRAKVLVGLCGAWWMVGAVAAAAGVQHRTAVPPLAWVGTTLLGAGCLGVLAGSRRHAVPDGGLLLLFAMVRAARLPKGLYRRGALDPRVVPFPLPGRSHDGSPVTEEARGGYCPPAA